ncbi:MAG TPA: peptidase E [Ktedonosporobacter sp.]|jgi:peptidase E|nr:peptidase E [Ktedonosporobacter sp.]
MSKHILAGSAGFMANQGIPTLGPVIQYGLELTKQAIPRLCYLGTACGDVPAGAANFYTACQNHQVIPGHLALFPMPNTHNVKDFLLAQHMIWVGGGSVANLLAVWRTHGLDEILREAWEKGIVLGGISAGSICWHTGGTTDSFGVELRAVTNGLGFVPYSNGVHYDSEERRRPLFQKLINDGILPEGYATDDGVALHYVDRNLHKVVSDTPGKYAYQVVKTESGVQESRIEAELLQ